MTTKALFRSDGTRKTEIVTTALRIVDAHGIKGLTVARIAREVGFVESALYRHFRSKNDLIAFILDEMIEAAGFQLAEVRAMPLAAEEALGFMFRLHLEFLELHPGIYRIRFSDELPLGDEEIRDRILRLTEMMLGGIASFIRGAIREGAFRPDLDADIAAVHYLGLIQASFIFWTMKNRRGSLPAIGAGLYKQMNDGFRAATGDRRRTRRSSSS
jgi:AcrR family transcriptional regulator